MLPGVSGDLPLRQALAFHCSFLFSANISCRGIHPRDDSKIVVHLSMKNSARNEQEN